MTRTLENNVPWHEQMNYVNISYPSPQKGPIILIYFSNILPLT